MTSNNRTMRYNIILLIVLLLGWGFTSCAQDAPNIKIGVMSDPHYLSEQLMDDGSAIHNIVNISGKAILDVPQVLDQVLNDYLNSDIEVLLIPGDITKDGEKQSHIDFVKKLKPLINKGVKIYVIPGNHDINIPYSSRYEGDKVYRTENVSPSEFSEIYAECGYSSAFKRDSSSLSYVAKLNDKTWLLAVDVCRYKENTTLAIASGQLSPDTEQWIVGVMNEAKQNNIQVVSMMHQGLVEHIMFQATFFKDYVVNDWQRLAPLFADLGIKAIFTGHFHANDITEYRSAAGNKIFDIETASLCAYPFAYRFVELDKDGMTISTRNITSTPNKPNLAVENKEIMYQRGKALAMEKITSMGMQFPEATTTLMADMIGKIFVMHLAGDEVVDEDLKTTMKQLYKELDSTSPLPIDKMELDFYPADNNVRINF